MIQKRALLLTIVLPVFFLLIAPVDAQNLLDNQYMRQAREYRMMARRALNEGSYEEAVEYAALAEEYTEKAEVEADRLARMYRANTLLSRARDRVAYIKLIGASERLGDVFTEAESHYRDAQKLFEAEAYEQSVESSRKVLSMLEIIDPARITQEEVLPRYYIVKWGDCMWRISDFDFVYDDPYKWRILYEANKEKLVDPENPHLIHPGQIFEIPGIKGETRRGTYKE